MIRVLVVDDSALVRDVLTRGLSRFEDIEVVGTAPDVYVARDKIVLRAPDVVTLDIEMPKMDGVEFLRRLMPQYPIPVVVVSAMAERGAKATLDALEYGAVDFVLKPSVKMASGLDEMIVELAEKIRIASRADLKRWRRRAPKRLRTSWDVLEGTTDKVVALGASTGGTSALGHMIAEFPPNMPGTVVVQHMPPTFTRLFAERLDASCAVEVKEATTGDRILSGRVLIAPGGYHVEVIRSGGQYRVKCSEGEKVNGHCPSVEVLFRSMVRSVGSNCVAVMLTGMGRDGATALVDLRGAGARTFAQDEASSVVFGMPQEAFRLGGAERLVSLDDMTATILKVLGEMK